MAGVADAPAADIVSSLKADLRPVGAWFIFEQRGVSDTTSTEVVVDDRHHTGQAKVEQVRSIVALAADSLT